MQKLSPKFTLIFALVGLLALIFSPQIAVLPASKNLLDWVRFGILPTLMLLVLLLSCFRRLNIAVWTWLPIALLAPQELFYLTTYGKPTDAHALAIVFETDLSEASGYLSGLGALLLTALVLILILFVLASQGLGKITWPRYARLGVWSVVLLGMLYVADEERRYAIAYPIAEKANTEETLLSRRPLPQSHNLFHQTYPINLLLAANEYRVQQQALKNIALQSQDFQFGASQQVPHQQRQIYVLVIGETLRPDRMQLNGYSRPTMPRLSGLGAEVISFQDMVSPWAWTRMSVPVIISRKPAADTRYFFPEKSLVAAFSEAGFKTYWLSTQSPLGVHDSSIALHANEADEVSYLNPVGYKKEGFYDEVILPAFERIVQRQEPKQLIVVHTLGSHFSYADRYPDNFDLFQPSGKGQQLGMHDRNNKTKLNNAYDNTIAYTDYLLFHLIEAMRSQQAVSSLLLVADHGENIFDCDCDKSGHGHNTEYDYRVGALWWGSEQFHQWYAPKVAQLKRAAKLPLMTTQTFHTLLDLAQIGYPQADVSQSYAAVGFRPTPRILASGHDFDLVAKDKICKLLPPARH